MGSEVRTDAIKNARDIELDLTAEQRAEAKRVSNAFLAECGIDPDDYETNRLEWAVKSAISAASRQKFGFCIFEDDPTISIDEALYILAECEKNC